jgi:KipI family sensor histidine kinase inhibitor
MDVRLQCVGADAIMLYAQAPQGGAVAFIGALADSIERELGGALVDLVPSFTSLLVIYDPLQSSHTVMARQLRQLARNIAVAQEHAGKTVTLPVYYAAEAGQDIERLADNAGLGVDEVITLHSSRKYRVYAIGFAPGFAYLGDVDERIACPRLATPRLQVPRGSVAIAERQTAVYPAVSPGGWNLLGRCPTTLFNPHSKPHMPVAVGDNVRFEPITRTEFLRMGGELE